MKKKHKTIAVVPARAGSKGLPGKNLKLLLGKPLICWTIELALSSKNIDLVMVSTDSKEIADLSLKHGAEVPFIRPDILATDTATSFSVVEHALNFYSTEKNEDYDFVALLEPTSPIREIDDIDNMINRLTEFSKDKDAIISLGEASENPAHMKIFNDDGSIIPYNINDSNDLRRQDQKKIYFPYGGAYICKVETLRKEKSFYPKRTIGYTIEKYQNYEVDSLYDFLCVESILKNKNSMI